MRQNLQREITGVSPFKYHKLNSTNIVILLSNINSNFTL